MNQPKLERIDGVVVAIRFMSETFTVALFDKQGGNEISIVGNLAGIEEGDRLSLYGREADHPKYGHQFRVEYFHPMLEQTRHGIRRFLLEEVEGIGKVFAERIVSFFYPKYGDTMLEALQKKPEELRDVPRLGQTRIDALMKVLRESYANRNLLLKLYEYGVTPKMARKIWLFYEGLGLDPLRVVEETPYQMMLDIEGLGFESVDRIARQQGVPLDDEGRLCAAVNHVLMRAYNKEGHLFLPQEEFVRKLNEIIWPDQRLPVNYRERMIKVFDSLQTQGYVQMVKMGEELVFYAKFPWQVEQGVVTHVARLLHAPIQSLTFFGKGLEEVRHEAEVRADITLDPDQRLAFKHAMEQGVCIITGGPGTGKSTLARLIVDTWNKEGLEVKLAAPTGRAARRLSETTGREATTIHRLLEWRKGKFERNETKVLEAEAVLIDESSMLDARLAWSLCRAIPTGCRVLFMGDVDQLPSVGAGNVLRDLIESKEVPVARLNLIHRQDTSKENLIVNLAHAVNQAPPGESIPGGPVTARRPKEGNLFIFDTRWPWARCSCGDIRLPKHCPSCGAGRVVARLSPAERGTELVQQLVTKRIPATFEIPSEHIQVIAPRYGGGLGVDKLNERLRDALNPANLLRPELKVGNHHFRMGDRVMAIRNQYEKDVVNGLQGRVTDVDLETKAVTAHFDGDVIATFSGIEELDDLTHAYAITVHKSQGNEFPVVLLALDHSAGLLLYRQLVYTAITRARTLLILVGDPAALARATANDRPRHRWTGLDWWLPRWQKI